MVQASRSRAMQPKPRVEDLPATLHDRLFVAQHPMCCGNALRPAARDVVKWNLGAVLWMGIGDARSDRAP